MLKGISPVISPELLMVMHQMGHGDELVLADAHFPGHTMGRRVVRADGLGVPALLEGILPLFELDDCVADALVMMDAFAADVLDPQVEAAYRAVIDRVAPQAPSIVRIDRFAFYERAQSAYAVVMTGEVAKYGNLILKKGVTPVV
jgi:L-fucose mutarotase